MKAAARCLAALALGAIALGPACKGTDVDMTQPPDDFFDGPDGFGVGSSAAGGGFFGTCLGPPTEVHATLAHNGASIRDDAKAGANIGAETIDVVGVLGAITDTSFEVDVCGLVACDQPDVYSAAVKPGNGGLTLPAEGTFVRLVYTAEDDGAFSVVLENVPTLEGMSNPVDTTTHVWFQAMAGFVDDEPFTASFTLADRCWTADGSIKARNMYVEAAGNPGERLEIPMGTTMPWTISEGPNAGMYDVTNLRSYADGELAFSSMLVMRH